MPSLKQLWRFGAVGVAATATHFTVGLGLHHVFGVHPFKANLVAFCCALAVSFLGQTRFTFPDAAADGQAFLRFTLVAVSGLLINQFTVWLVTSVLGGPYWLALVILVCTVPVFTFVMLKRWALRH